MPDRDDPRRPESGPSPAISVQNLTKVYDGPNGEIRAVDGVSFTVEEGTVVGVLGPNGAGKTTMIKSMLGLIIPTEGTVHLDGIDVHDDPHETYRNTGAMLEGARNIYWRLTVRENLEFFASLVGHTPGEVRERHDELLETFDLTERADETVKELSRGMKQKVSLASTLSRGASVLFLDEPTLGLDVESSVELRRELHDLVERESMTVVLSSHDMDVIEELCDRVIILNDGEIIADDTVENLTGVFASQAYEVTMDGTVPERTRATLQREYAVENWEQPPEGADRFEIVLEDGQAMYGLTDVLEESGRPVASLDAIQPDLESIFLELTNRDATGGRRPTARRPADEQPKDSGIPLSRSEPQSGGVGDSLQGGARDSQQDGTVDGQHCGAGDGQQDGTVDGQHCGAGDSQQDGTVDGQHCGVGDGQQDGAETTVRRPGDPSREGEQ